MKTAAPKGGGADGDRRTTGPSNSTPHAAAVQVDLPALRARLVLTRARLLERIDDEWEPDRRFPDTAWCKLLADVQMCIMAVDAVASEDGP